MGDRCYARIVEHDGRFHVCDKSQFINGDGYSTPGEALRGVYRLGYTHILAVDIFDILEDIDAGILASPS